MTGNKRFTFADGFKIVAIRENGEIMNSIRVCDKLNELHEENQRLKEALLFFVDVANSQCSSNWRKDMENDCQKLFNCSYEEAKEKYDDYDGTWWELGL